MKSKIKIEENRNTQSNVDYYEGMANLMAKSGLSHNEIVWDFPVFSSRQQITYLLERYEIFKKIISIPGSIIELGVAGGFGLMSFAHFCSIFEPTHYVRKIYGFDTFDGFPSIGVKDVGSNAEHMKIGGLKYDSYDYLQQIIKYYDKNRFLSHIPKISLIKGDVCQTLPKFLDEKPSLVVSLLYLDVDLYDPTKIALELLVERIPKGGIIVFDELNHEDYPGETNAVHEVLNIKNLKLERIPFSSMAAFAVID